MPVMTEYFHRTSDKRLVNCNKKTGKSEPSDKCLFHRHFPFTATWHSPASFDRGGK